MSDIQQRISDVLHEHTPCGSEGPDLVGCWCYERFDTFADHANHVAAIVVSELGLTREENPWSLDVVDGMPASPFYRSSRYVTEWAPE